MSNQATAAIALVLLAGLGACSPQAQNSTDALDNELVNGISADPALTSALGNQIVVDPALARGAKPAAGSAPGGNVTPGRKLAASGDGCDFKPGFAWATKLPDAVALYPGAKVSEAAGSDAAGCRRRIVSFTAAVPPAKLLEHYRARVTAAGYSAEHLVENGANVLGGTRGEAAYYLTIRPASGGSAVDLVAN